MALISLQQAQLAFGHVPLLDHADFALEVGERVGLIRFGSRVDVYLPQGTEPRPRRHQPGRPLASTTSSPCAA